MVVEDNKNNEQFWENYLLKIIQRLEELANKKKIIKMDLHIHSDYSIDSTQKLSDIIDRANLLNLDVISITDHDSIKVYDELYEFINNNKSKTPIIIPGVEFTIDNEEYGSQFHILQLMINPKEKTIIKDIQYQEQASWIRAKKQIERLNQNKAMNYFFKKYHYKCTLEGFSKFLKGCQREIPEYKTMMDYIRKETFKYPINNWDILKKMEEYNEKDSCLERKNIKIIEYETLKEKYKSIEESGQNERFFHRLLAVRGADDDFFKPYPSAGDLSVNKFDELTLDQLNKKYLTIFAHPSENKLYLLEKFKKMNPNICGIEMNKRCKYENRNNFDKTKEKLKLIKTIGSDSHNIDSNLYDDMIFYQYTKEELLQLIKKMKEYVIKNKEG